MHEFNLDTFTNFALWMHKPWPLPCDPAPDKAPTSPPSPTEVVVYWPAGSGTIDNEVFETFLKRLGPPLGLRAHATNAEVFKLAAQLQVPLVNGRLPFTRTTYELVRVHMGQDLPLGDIREQLHALIDRHCGVQVCASTPQHRRGPLLCCAVRSALLWRGTLAQTVRGF